MGVDFCSKMSCRVKFKGFHHQWVSNGPTKVPKTDFQIQKTSDVLKKQRTRPFFVIDFLKASMFETLCFLKWNLIFDGSFESQWIKKYLSKT